MTCNDTYCSNRINFLKIRSYSELHAFLQNVSLKHAFVHHITTVKALTNILDSRSWRLSSGSKTNDLQELCEKGDFEERSRIFTISFSHGDEECIGMWKMYLKQSEQNDQICLSFPVKNIRKWFESLKTTNTYYIHTENNQRLSQRIDDISFHDIVYAHGNQGDKNARLCWGNIIKDYTQWNRLDASQIPLLTGFIKNSAWEYEKESRLMIKISSTMVDSANGYIFVPFPKELWKNVKVTLGPFVQGDALADLKEKMHNEPFKTFASNFASFENSYFQGKVNL